MKTKKLLLLAIALFFIFSHSAQAQNHQSYYIETDKFDQYAKQYPNAILYRYDALNRLVLMTSPFNKDTVGITSYTYDAVGNRLSQTSILFYKDKSDKDKYICNVKLDPNEFQKLLQNIFDLIDNKKQM